MAKRKKAEPDDSSKIKLSLLTVPVGGQLCGVGRCVVTLGRSEIQAIAVRVADKKLVSTYEDCLNFLTRHSFPTEGTARVFLDQALDAWDRNEEQEKLRKAGSPPSPTGKELHQETVGRIVDGVLEDARAGFVTSKDAVQTRLGTIAQHMQAAYDDITAIDVLCSSPNACAGLYGRNASPGPFPFCELAAAALIRDLFAEVEGREQFQALPSEDPK